MRKQRVKQLGLFAAAAVVFLCMQMLSGCGKSNLDKYADNISERREYLFAAESTEYKITAIAGNREDPYELDGESKSKRDFTVLTVTPSTFAADKTYRYRARIGEATYEGDLLPHPFAQSLSVDIPAAATEDFDVQIVTDGGEQSLHLESAVTGDNIGAEKALTIALDKLKHELKRFKSKGKLRAEIYVRLMENPIDGNGGYFWYVAFVGENKDTVAILLKSDTGAVSATRI